MTALTTGAADASENSESSPVNDAYAGLKERVKTRLAGRADAEQLLAQYENPRNRARVSWPRS